MIFATMLVPPTDLILAGVLLDTGATSITQGRGDQLLNARKLYNPIVALLLRSPLHALVSGSVMLITYTGHKSGRRYSTPVSYVPTRDALLVVSPRDRVWWRSLRPQNGVGAPVTVRVRGKDLRTRATAFEGEAAEEGLLAVLRSSSAHRRYWGVELGADGQPTDPRALRRVAEGHALVRVEAIDGELL